MQKQCIFLFLLATALVACATTGAPRSKTGAALSSIASLEETRHFDEDSFRSWIQNPGPEIRAAAARALGRIGDKAAVKLLYECTRDPAPTVRIEAIFALGQIGAQESASLLMSQCADSEPAIRLAAIEALGKAGEENGGLALLIGFLKDADASVRGEAAIAIYRLYALPVPLPKPSAQGAVLRREALQAAIAKETDATARWKMAYALASFSDAAARPTFLTMLRDQEPLCRNFAAWGLEKIAPTPEDDEPLRAALADRDDAVASRAALALGKRASAENVTALASALQRDSFHVRRAAAEGLGGMRGEEARVALEKGLFDSSVTVAAEARLSLVKLGGVGKIERILEGAKDSNFLVRGKCAASCTLLRKDEALPLLEVFLADTDVRVASAAASALRNFPCDETRKLAILALERDDLSVRAEAAETLGAIGDATVIPFLQRAYDHSPGHDMDEAREKIETAIRKLDPKAPKISASTEPVTQAAPEKQSSLERAGPRRAAIETSKGRLIAELYPDDAPKHVENFFALARLGHFDGTIFHRVVTNWVVQGGDHRGDGWGATSASGGYLRDEIGRRPFIRGSIGMPKGDARDSGGCQIFITLLPTPKLDGRYTMFGQVVEGLEILDRLEIGDKILSVRPQEISVTNNPQ